MKASILFKQYVWLVDTIQRCKRITLAELNERWLRTELSEGRPLSRTTFNRHRSEVEEIFGIIIGCDADNRYYIVSSDVLHTDSVQQWMLNTLTVSNIVGEARNLHDRILLESIPTEGEMLRQIVEAMQRGVLINITGSEDMGLEAAGVGSPCLQEYWLKNHGRETLSWIKYWLKKTLHLNL